MGKGKRVISTDEEIKVFADPYRMRIIETFIEHRKPMTVKDVADILGEVPAKIHYHVKKLISIDILELDHIEVIHGINAKYYILSHDSFTFQVNKEDDLKTRFLQVEGISRIVMNQIESFRKDFIERGEIIQSKSEIDESDGLITSSKVFLDEKDYEEFSKLIFDFIKDHNSQSGLKKKYSLFVGLIGKE